MSEKIIIHPIDSVYIGIECSDSISRELWEKYSFKVPNFQYMPAFKRKHWDGYIRLYNIKNHKIYAGLKENIIQFCNDRKIEYEDLTDVNNVKITEEEIIKFFDSLKLPEHMVARNYQIETLKECINNKRATILSATGSGKSLSIYGLCRYYEKKTLIIVPTISLTNQMFGDFKDYSVNLDWNVDEECSIIIGGVDKYNLNNITISTWQSIYNLDKEWFDQWDLIIVDEVHEAQAKSIKSILEKCTECEFRFGFTGTLDGIELNKLVIEGLLGKITKVSDAKSLIDQGYLSTIDIKCILLEYNNEIKSKIKKDYHEEIDFIVTNEKRNELIAKLASSLKGNTLILFKYIEKQGLPLYEILSKLDSDKKINYIDGSVEALDREEIRKNVDFEKENNIIIASFGTFQRGINIVNLHNIILASPSKSRIRLMQSIGRGLRKKDSKTHLIVYDIADDLSTSSKKNYTFEHFAIRLKMYLEEGFQFKIKKIKLY